MSRYYYVGTPGDDFTEDFRDAEVTATGSTTPEAMASWMKTVNEGRHWGLQRTIPRKVHAKLWTNAYNRLLDNGLKTQIRLLAFGDSLAGYKPPMVIDALEGAMGIVSARSGGAYVADGYEPPPVQAVPASVSGTYVADATGTFNANAGDGYSYWPMYPLSQVLNTTRVKFIKGGVDPYFTNCVIYYVKEPGAGTMQVLVGGALVATLDANAALGLGRYEITQAYAQAKVELLGTGGAIRLIGVFSTDTTSNAVENWVAGYGGILLSDSIASATCRTLFQAWVTDVAPDIFTFEMADAVAGWEAALNQLGVILDAAIPHADKVFSAAPPSLADDYIAQRDILEKVCRERGYIFFDGNAPLQPHTEMVSLGWDADGVHPANAAKAFTGSLLVRQLGLDGFSARASGTPVAATGFPSIMGSGSKFQAPNGLAVSVTADDAAAFDWTMLVPRTLKLKVGSVLLAQFGDLGVGYETIIPNPTLPNNSPLRAKDNAGNVTELLKMDNSNFVTLRYKPGSQFSLVGSGNRIFANDTLLYLYGPSILGGLAPNASGAKHSRVSTGSIAGGARGDVTVTWGTAFADANYTAIANVIETSASGTGLRVERIRTQAAGSVVVQVMNDSAGALTGTLHVVAFHD